MCRKNNRYITLILVSPVEITCTIHSQTFTTLLYFPSKSCYFSCILSKWHRKTHCYATSLLLPQRIWQNIPFSYKLSGGRYCIMSFIEQIFLFSGCHNSARHCRDGGPDTPWEREIFPYLHRGEAAFPQPARSPLKGAVCRDPSVQRRAPKWVLDLQPNFFTQ